MLSLAVAEAARHSDTAMMLGLVMFILGPVLIAVVAGIYIGHQRMVKSVIRFTAMIATAVLVVGCGIFVLVFG